MTLKKFTLLIWISLASNLLALDSTEKNSIVGNSYTLSSGNNGFYQEYATGKWFLYIPSSNYFKIHEAGKLKTSEGAYTINKDQKFTSFSYSNGVLTIGSVISGQSTTDLDQMANRTYTLGTGNNGFYQEYTTGKWFLYISSSNYFKVHEAGKLKTSEGAITLSGLNFNLSQGHLSVLNTDQMISSLSNDSNLTDTLDSTLRNKSIITVRNNSDTLQFRLTSFDSPTNTYKKVSLSSGFTASSLSGDVNASASSNIPSSGECGNWVATSSTTFNLNKTDNNTTFEQNAATYSSSDGNLTIDSTYEKVVWYGEYIPVSGITCNVDALPTYGDCINGTNLTNSSYSFPQFPANCTNLQ